MAIKLRTVSILVVFANVWHCCYSQNRGIGRSRYEYPDPMHNYEACNRNSRSFVCDPDRLIAAFEAEQLNNHIISTMNDTMCPCSHYSCSQTPGGYKIGIALLKRILPDDPMQDDEDLNEQESRDKKRQWTLEEAKKFTQHLLGTWNLGHCEETVIIFYSLDDSVLYVAAGEVARVKLNHSRINSILTSARAQFEPDGNLFKGLLKIVKDFRNVFFGTYQPGKPSTSESRSDGAKLHNINSCRIFVVGLSVIAMISVHLWMKSKHV